MNQRKETFYELQNEKQVDPIKIMNREDFCLQQFPSDESQMPQEKSVPKKEHISKTKK